MQAMSADQRTWSDVPWRTIIASVAVVLGTYVLLTVVLATVRILAWVAIAGFLAIVLAPAVRFVQRLLGGRRTLAACLVMFTALAATLGTLALFLLPVRNQLIGIITDLPGTAVEVDKFHRQHAVVELAIRDLKEGAGLDHVPSGNFHANSAWLQCAVLAHNLIRWTAIAGSTIWCKFIASFALSRHAHASWLKGKA